MISSRIIGIILSVFMLLMTSPSYAGKVSVIASIAPMADFVRQVGGERVDVKLLLPPGASPHTFEPTPKIVKVVSTADLFVKVGAGLEFWAEKIVRASGNKRLTVVDSSSEVALIQHTDEHDVHTPGGVDPHIWLDPSIASSIVSKIEKALSMIDPQGAAFYKKNATEYRKKLSALDRDIASRVGAFRTKGYVTFHPAWEYFSRRYGLRVVGVIEEAPGKEPSPKHVANIIREIKQTGSKVVFVEPQFNPKIGEAIAKEANARVLYLDPIGGKDPRKTYIEMMRYNIGAMEKAMK